MGVPIIYLSLVDHYAQPIKVYDEEEVVVYGEVEGIMIAKR